MTVRGLERVRTAQAEGHGVLITPNHFTYTDLFLLTEAADELGAPFYFMTAWQVFATSGWVTRLVLRQHGCFSVDREGADLRAFRQAVSILQDRPHPLVIFPEGEMYHVGDRVLPFHEGPAATAMSAAKHGTPTFTFENERLCYREWDMPVSAGGVQVAPREDMAHAH